MNRFVVSAGVMMMGVAGLKAANITGLAPQQSSKWWSVSASLKGFYDDNVSASFSKQGSPGIEFEPSFSLHLPRERTLVTAKYTYRLNYYADRPDTSTDSHHQLGFRVNHRFTERYTLNVEDSFVYSDEAAIIAGENGVSVGFGRSNGNAVRNYAPIDFNARLTRLIGVGLGYRNAYIDYEETGMDEETGAPSRSALLDRMEHEFHVEGEWYFSETTIGFVGYQFGISDYLSNEELVPGGRRSSSRNSRSHYGYIGASHTFNKQLSGSAKVGVQAVDYYRQNETDLSPYVDMSATYAYLPGSNLKLGVQVSHAATDLVEALDQLATVVYGGITHRITPRITGSLMGQYLHSTFNGGNFDGESEDFVNLGLSLNYQINQNFSANLAYSYDVLSSGTSNADFRDFNRNRVWGGVTVTY